MDGKEVHPELLKSIQHTEATYHTADYINDIRIHQGQVQAQIVWEGLPDEVDYTWESVEQVFDNLPTIL